MVFKDRLRLARTRLRLTQEAVGKPLGVTAQAVSQWERGETYPEIEKLPELSRVLHTSVTDLLGAPSQPIGIEVALLDAFRKLTPDQQKRELWVIKGMAEEAPE